MDTAAGALGGGVAVVAVGTEGTELTQCKSLASWGASSSDYELAAPFGKRKVPVPPEKAKRATIDTYSSLYFTWPLPGRKGSAVDADADADIEAAVAVLAEDTTCMCVKGGRGRDNSG